MNSWKKLSTKQKVSLVHKFYQKGDTALILFGKLKKFGVPSRASIIGLLNRNKDKLLTTGEVKHKSSKGTPKTRITRNKPKTIKQARSDKRQSTAPVPVVIHNDQPTVSLEHLAFGMCKFPCWPTSEPPPGYTDKAYCGGNVEGTSSYCEHHKKTCLRKDYTYNGKYAAKQ